MVTAAVLPIKTYERAKQRLSDAVGIPDRRALAEAMVGDVLDALPSVAGLDRVIAVTAEPLAAAAARDAGASVVHDPHEAGQSAAALIGIRAALEAGAERVLLVPGDCPALDPGEVAGLLARSEPRGRGDRARPPRRRHQRAAALPARRDRAVVRPRLVRPPRGARARGRDQGARRRGALARPRRRHARRPPRPARGARGAARARAPRTRELLARMLPAAAAAG